MSLIAVKYVRFGAVLFVGKRLICARDVVNLLVRVVSTEKSTGGLKSVFSVYVRYRGFHSYVELFVENCSLDVFLCNINCVHANHVPTSRTNDRNTPGPEKT
jgi:hypothetical protein